MDSYIFLKAELSINIIYRFENSYFSSLHLDTLDQKPQWHVM